MKLIIDLSKGAGLNRGKLVKRAVQVRGKNGKIFTRMQWVNPNDEQATVKVQGKQEEPEQLTRKEHIDRYVKGLTSEEKDHLVNKHGVQFSHHENPARHQINKVMALKSHLMNNPHLIGAEHLPEERKATDKEVLHSATQHFLDVFTKKSKDLDERRAHLHKMIHDEGFIHKHPDFTKLKLHNSPLDPKNYPSGEFFSDDDEQTRKAPIHHMHRLRLFKDYLKQNPHRMKELMENPEHSKWFTDEHRDTHSGFGLDGNAPPKKPTPAPTATPEPIPKVEPKVNTGSKEVEFGKLVPHVGRDNMYNYLNQVHGMNIVDPALDPNVKDNMKPIAHKNYVLKFKNLLLQNPTHLREKLGSDAYVKEIDESAKKMGIDLGNKATDSSSGNSEHADGLEKMFAKMSRESKKKYIEMFKNHPSVNSSRLSQWNKGDYDGTGYSTAWGEVKKLLKENPDLYNKHREEIEDDFLMDTTTPNVREVTRFIRDKLGLTQGLKNGERVELDGDRSDRMWLWYPDNSAQITRDDDGKPIFSVFYGGPDGTEDRIFEIPLKEFREFVDTMRSNPTATTTTSKPKDVPEVEQKPLHERPGQDIVQALSNDISLLTKEVAESPHLRKYVSRLWAKNGYTPDVMQLALSSGTGTTKVYKAILSEMGVPITANNNIERSFYKTNEAKELMYRHLVQTTKQGNSKDLIINNNYHKNDTWLLHESAKHWTVDERSESRSEFLTDALNISSGKMSKKDQEEYKPHLVRLLKEATDFMPYDMLTDMVATNHLGNFSIDGRTGGSYHSATDRSIALNHRFLEGYKDKLSSDLPLSQMYGTYTIGGNKYKTHAFSDTVAHEVAHAVDHFLSVGDTSKISDSYLEWGNTNNMSKYLNGVKPTVVPDSYKKAVASSNPNGVYYKGKNGSSPYGCHLDEFISAYEGRIYSKSHSAASSGSSINGAMRTGSDIVSDNYLFGLEHWSEGVSRVVNAHRIHRDHEAQGRTRGRGLDEYSKAFHDNPEFQYNVPSITSKTGNVADDLGRNSLTDAGNRGEALTLKSYHIMKQKHPELTQAIEKMFIRNDFLDGSGEHPRTSSLSVKKSETPAELYVKL